MMDFSEFDDWSTHNLHEASKEAYRDWQDAIRGEEDSGRILDLSEKALRLSHALALRLQDEAARWSPEDSARLRERLTHHKANYIHLDDVHAMLDELDRLWAL